LERQVEWQAPQKLTDFLDSGPPPVFVGFGSMNTITPEKLTDIVLRALKLTGQRGLLAGAGWATLIYRIRSSE